MLTLSPAKILVVLVIALIVLGPDKLPGLARQMGAAWGDLRRFRARLESEVRGVFPDLPPAHEVAQAVRSPLAFLDRLADEHERSQDDGPATVVEEAEPPAAGAGSPPPGAGQGTPPGGPLPNGAGPAAVPSSGSANGSASSGSNGSGARGAGAHRPPGAGATHDTGHRATPDDAVPAPFDDPSMN